MLLFVHANSRATLKDCSFYQGKVIQYTFGCNVFATSYLFKLKILYCILYSKGRIRIVGMEVDLITLSQCHVYYIVK